jgi:hypothetical protein
MAYSMRFTNRAKEELNDCCSTYGETLRTDLWNWLHQLAANSESGNDLDSIDVIEIIDEALTQDEAQWRYSLRRWWRASLLDKVRAATVMLKKRCPPWQLRFTARWFTVLARFDCEVRLHYFVDHVHKHVIFVLFDGLPGQD